jgi:hypothetical protein
MKTVRHTARRSALSTSESAASVPSLKFVVHISEQPAALARRADDGIWGIFRGGQTQPASSRAAEIRNELQRRDTRIALKILVGTSMVGLEFHLQDADSIEIDWAIKPAQSRNAKAVR